MKYLIIGSLVFGLMAVAIGAQEVESERRLQRTAFATPAGGFRGKSDSGSGFRGRGSRFHKGGRFQHEKFHHPRHFRRNFGGIWRFYRPEDRSYYPHQGGSDYRDWYYRDWYYRDWFDLPRR